MFSREQKVKAIVIIKAIKRNAWGRHSRRSSYRSFRQISRSTQIPMVRIWRELHRWLVWANEWRKCGEFIIALIDDLLVNLCNFAGFRILVRGRKSTFMLVMRTFLKKERLVLVPWAIWGRCLLIMLHETMCLILKLDYSLKNEIKITSNL
jgi:hypothetical protein